MANIIEKFLDSAAFIKENYSATAHLCAIKGKRWSYIAGNSAADISGSLSFRVPLDKQWGIVVYHINKYPVSQKNEIVKIFDALI